MEWLKMNKKIWILAGVGVLIAIGMAVTIDDWKEWKRLETGRYGQGWGDLQAESRPLITEYSDKKLGVTLKLPEGLGVGEKIKVMEGENGDIGTKIWEEELPGGRLVVHQRLGKEVGGKIVVLETKFGEEEWGKWEKTVRAVYESVKSSLN